MSGRGKRFVIAVWVYISILHTAFQRITSYERQASESVGRKCIHVRKARQGVKYGLVWEWRFIPFIFLFTSREKVFTVLLLAYTFIFILVFGLFRVFSF